MTTSERTTPARPDYDVAIIGSGIAGSALAAVLARNGARVLILDAGHHPRFAIGESTIPYTSMLIRLVSERYGVPELKLLTTFHNAQANISSNFGVKRNFGFLYHRPGERQNPAEWHEFPIPRVTHTENHFFRQDLDAWVLSVAVKYGAVARQGERIVDVAIDDHGVDVVSAAGERWRARFVVDASGFRSPLADKFDLREKPTRLRHHSRSMFTHMLGVTPYENLVPHGTHGNVHPWHQGTLHHVFDGGWLWVIAFDNHALATSPLVSVGLQLDPRKYPKPEGVAPEEEFAEFISRFPDIAPQFAKARPVRPWVSTGRLQYTPRQTVGYRWCLTSHAAGFIDPLFSRGMCNTFEIINALTWRLLDALAEDDFSVERFAYVQELEQGQLDFNDMLVANAYASWRSYGLWDGWCRVWALAQLLATMEINRAYARFLKTHDRAILAPLEEIAPFGAVPPYEPLREMIRKAESAVRDVAEGDRDPEEAGEYIRGLFAAADFVPPVGLSDPNCKSYVGTFRVAGKVMRWAKNQAPDYVGRLVTEGMTLFIRHRFDRREFDLRSELRHAIAERPVLGRPLRVPVPR